MRVSLDTLGCKLNQAEAEILSKQFTEAGHRLVSQIDQADVYVLNTCTVTHTADAKARHLLRLAHRRNPDALVVATGCYAQRAPAELARLEGISLVAGNNEKAHLSQLLAEFGCQRHPSANKGVLTDHHCLTDRTRSFVKIQDGCSSFCSYCIVPLVRGKEKSEPVKHVLTELRERIASGYQEVVLTGTEIGSYHDNGVNLKGLLERILAETGINRLRLSSLQPQEISPELIGLWRDRRLCPHFHLSLQSGSDTVLGRMRRRYSVSDYRRAVSLIREMLPDAAITTDVIVGFPGETEADFAQSCDFCQQLGFARVHVFAYSPRSGTQAARLSHQVSDTVKKERSRKMMALAEESARSFQRQFQDETRPVLWEKQAANGLWCGLTDNYIRVYGTSQENLTNKLLPVRLENTYRDGMGGEIAEYRKVY